MAPPVNKHIMNVEEGEDTWTITYAKKVMEDEDEPEPVDEAMDDDDDDDEYRAIGDEGENEDDEDDEDEDDEEMQSKAFQRSVRSALLDLIGKNPAILERRSDTLQSISDLFGIDK